MSLSEEENFDWSWIGPPIEKKNNTHYNQVLAVRSSDSSRRVFETGDTVYVANNVGQVWIAQIVELYQKGVCLEDEECELVSEMFKTSSLMRCTFRWFYNADDESMNDSRRVSPHIPFPKRDEIYFSDHVEYGDTNPVEVIEGRAFLCSTVQEMLRFHDQHPKDYWKGDIIRLVRCFYGYNAGNPPPIRELGKGELELYLKNPSKDPDLYNKSRLSLYGRYGAVMKGTGQRKRHPCTDYADITRLSASDISTSEDGDHVSKLSRIADVSSSIIGMSIVSTNCTKESDGTERLSASDMKPAPPTVRVVDAQYGVSSKNISLQSRTNVSHVDDSVKAMRRPTKRKDEGEMDDSSGCAEQSVSECEEMKVEWRKLRKTLGKGTREQQEHFLRSLPQMLILFRKIMKECSLDFNMDEDSKKEAAKTVAKHIFGAASPPNNNR